MMKILMILMALISVDTLMAQTIFKNQFEALVASRVNQLNIKDPHFFTEVSGFCFDVTGVVNNEINTSISTDGDNDNNLDLNLITRFDTDQFSDIAGRSVSVQLVDGSCPDPLFSAACQHNGFLAENLISSVSTSQTCLSPEASNTSNYTPSIIDTQGPCYATNPVDITLQLDGLSLPLLNYQQAGRYPGVNGVLTMDQGLHKGFITETTAENITIPSFGVTLASLLPGGQGNCSNNDDRDIGPDGMTSGWWIYFNSESDLIELQ